MTKETKLLIKVYTMLAVLALAEGILLYNVYNISGPAVRIYSERS
jgi:hypothetical protein